MKFYLVGAVAALTIVSGCVTVDSSTVQEMPTGYLCSFLDPNTWISTESERSAIFAELKERKADCILPSGPLQFMRIKRRRAFAQVNFVIKDVGV